jgi:hypothetical protein
VPYKKLVSNSQAVMDNIYKNTGFPLSPELKKIFEQVEHANPIRKYGKHIYQLEDFGIDKSYIDQFTGEYQEFQKNLNIDS